jgi:hypothetical protein
MTGNQAVDESVQVVRSNEKDALYTRRRLPSARYAADHSGESRFDCIERYGDVQRVTVARDHLLDTQVSVRASDSCRAKRTEQRNSRLFFPVKTHLSHQDARYTQTVRPPFT